MPQNKEDINMDLLQTDAYRLTGGNQKTSIKTWKTMLYYHRNYFVILITPLVLLPIPIFINNPMGKCGYMMSLMGVYWVAEAVPIGATGMIPLFLAPALGLLTCPQVAANYMKDITVLVVGGLFAAIAVERSQLHKRIALSVLNLVGTASKWLMMGFMFPTFFCSMFISNTATTAMMLPIMEAVMDQLMQSSKTTGDSESRDDPDSESAKMIPESKSASNIISDKELNRTQTEETQITDVEKNSTVLAIDNNTSDAANSEPNKEPAAKFTNMYKGMTLAICYAANIGGTAALTGSPPNLVMKGSADEVWDSKGLGESPITYGSWMAFAFPLALLTFILCYLWLVLFYLGFRAFSCNQKRDENQQAAATAIANAYRNLGRITYAELTVLFMFILLVCLWFFRSPGFVNGWSRFFEEGYISDSFPAVFICFLFFCLPLNVPAPSTAKSKGSAPALLTWEDVRTKFPWDLIFIFGGGFALAQSAQTSGLSSWIGAQLALVGSMNDWIMIAIVCFVVSMVSEVTSNTATCTMLMPVMAAMAENLGRNPLYLMLPAALSTSYAFMLPVGTPPNAIAFSYGRLQVIDMVKGGTILKFVCAITVTLATQTWGYPLFHFNNIPWQNSTGYNAHSADVYNTTTSGIVYANVG